MVQFEAFNPLKYGDVSIAFFSLKTMVFAEVFNLNMMLIVDYMI